MLHAGMHARAWRDLPHAARGSLGLRGPLARIPLRREGSASDVASAIAYLVADAPFVTGQVLAVDGGRSVAL